jgi:lysophospholipase L1-like esterase
LSVRGKAGWLAYGAYLMVSVVVILLLIEVGLRLLFGLPKGYFDFQPLDNQSLYRPSAKIRMVWVPFPYTIQSNALGFRGPEITLQTPADHYRIVAVGDSITEGFYVNNDHTYPYLLEQALLTPGNQVEVVNAARGGASIAREFEIMRKFVLPLHPDMVLLNYVNNDMDELHRWRRSTEELLTLTSFQEDLLSESEVFFCARTALGELLLDTALRLTVDKYRQGVTPPKGANLNAPYTVTGSADIEGNVDLYLKRSSKFTPLLMERPYSEEARVVIAQYVEILRHMNDWCREQGIRLVMVYHPDYAQIFAPQKTSLDIRDILQQSCGELNIPFIDLTECFQQADREQPLFLAPVDYHPTAQGNGIAAE